jgi:hypothetical protein
MNHRLLMALFSDASAYDIVPMTEAVPYRGIPFDEFAAAPPRAAAAHG